MFVSVALPELLQSPLGEQERKQNDNIFRNRLPDKGLQVCLSCYCSSEKEMNTLVKHTEAYKEGDRHGSAGVMRHLCRFS